MPDAAGGLKVQAIADIEQGRWQTPRYAGAVREEAATHGTASSQTSAGTFCIPWTISGLCKLPVLAPAPWDLALMT
jgi:hypothetical protein